MKTLNNNNFPELWDYFQATKAHESFNSTRKIHSGLVLFKQRYRGAWYHLLLLTAVYQIMFIKLSTNTDNIKFTINYIIDTLDVNSLTEKDIYSFWVNNRHPRLMQLTIGASISGEFWYEDLKLRISEMVEKYSDTSIYGLGVRLYGSECTKSTHESLPDEVMKNCVWDILKGLFPVCSEDESPPMPSDLPMPSVPLMPMPSVKDVSEGSQPRAGINPWNVNSTEYISIIKCDKKTKTFIVGDIETIQIDDIHVPYAMGYTFAGEKDSSLFELSKPVTYCTESHYYSGDFKQRSSLMFDDFLRGLISYSKSHGTKRVYFHNLSRFDGILLLQLLLERQWIIKPVIREHNVYQVIVYDRCKPKVPVLDFRDSLKLLPGSLKSLAETMCPELGSKGSIPHDELNEFNISEKRGELIKYLEQDILILGGVLRKAQEKYWDRFHIDITNCLTVSSMAMKIYRTHYYPSTYPIYRPQPNRAAFIRRGYYGGHTDVYKPYGKGLFYYDVNSLYPYAMTNPMPGGKPVWHGSLKGRDLEQLFGFVEAKVTCPDSIKVPLLPYKDPKTGTLLFPIGTFTGVYFTEELKLASELGYQIELKHGYLFDKMDSPFSGFVSEIYEERRKAKMRGDQVMSSLHKLTMNSLYGRFGIRPESNITEICDKDRLDELMSIYQFSMVEPINSTHYVISYTGELQKMNNEKDSVKISNLRSWMDLRNGSSSSAVQMSAAITAYARIHMYKYISLPGSYYTDTDSVVLDKPLPDFEVSSTELGKLKLEHEVVEGYFLAPKCYALVFNDSTHLIRNKGLAKDQVDLLWFMEQYKNLDRVLKRTVESSFRINWPKLQVYRTKIMLNLGIDPSTKRDLVIDDNGIWIDTLPKRISNTEDLRSERPGSPGKQPPASVGPEPDHVASGELPLGEAPRIEHSVREEELQTVKEELRTVKEELRSVKEEVQAKHLRLEEEHRVERSRLEEERSRLSKDLQNERVMRSHLEKELQAERERLDDEEMLRTECERLEEELRTERLVCQNIEERLRDLKLRGVDIGNDKFLFSDDQKWAMKAERERQRRIERSTDTGTTSDGIPDKEPSHRKGKKE